MYHILLLRPINMGQIKTLDDELNEMISLLWRLRMQLQARPFAWTHNDMT